MIYAVVKDMNFNLFLKLQYHNIDLKRLRLKMRGRSAYKSICLPNTGPYNGITLAIIKAKETKDVYSIHH